MMMDHNTENIETIPGRTPQLFEIISDQDIIKGIL